MRRCSASRVGSGGAVSPALCRRPEAPLELPDQALELGDPLAQGGIPGVKPPERGGRLIGTRLPPAGV
jgi:hypothetical protein